MAKKIYRVNAEVISDVYVDIEAESEEEALRLADNMDGGEFIEDPCGGEFRITNAYVVEEPEEEIEAPVFFTPDNFDYDKIGIGCFSIEYDELQSSLYIQVGTWKGYELYLRTEISYWFNDNKWYITAFPDGDPFFWPYDINGEKFLEQFDETSITCSSAASEWRSLWDQPDMEEKLNEAIHTFTEQFEHRYNNQIVPPCHNKVIETILKQAKERYPEEYEKFEKLQKQNVIELETEERDL